MRIYRNGMARSPVFRWWYHPAWDEGPCDFPDCSGESAWEFHTWERSLRPSGSEVNAKHLSCAAHRDGMIEKIKEYESNAWGMWKEAKSKEGKLMKIHRVDDKPPTTEETS